MRTRARTVVVLATTTTAALLLGLPTAADARPLAGVRVTAPKAPASLTAGAKTTTAVTVTNPRATRSGAGTLRLYLSAAHDTRLAQHAVAALPARGHAKVTLTGRVPADLKPGRYRLLVSLDARGTTTKPSHGGGRAVTIKPAAAAPKPTVPHPPTAPAPAAPLGSLANDTAPFVVQADNAPVAAAVTATTAEDTPASVAPSAADADGDALTYAVATAPQHGVATTDGATFTYTPDADYHGTDTFTYVADDGTTDSAPATATITVTAVNDAPVAVDDVATLDEDGSATFAWAMVLTNDTDADGDPLTGTVATQPAHGTLTETAGTLTYTPDADYHGTDTFTYTADDGTTDSAPATVSLVVASVNDAPVAHADGYRVVAGKEADVLATFGPLVNDTDADGDALSLDVLGNVAHGTLTTSSVGSFTYEGDAGYSGTDSFTYSATDGTADSAPVTVTLQVDQAPVTMDDDYTTRERRALTINAAGGPLANDTDAESDPLTLAAGGLRDFAHGTATSNDDGSFTYTPRTGFTGDDTATYVATDGLGRATGSVTIHVTPDVAPVAQDDSYNFSRNSMGGLPAEDGVLANDSDADGDHLTVTLLQPGTLGTMSLNADGSFFYRSGGTSGTDTITYQVSDGLLTTVATITINIS